MIHYVFDADASLVTVQMIVGDVTYALTSTGYMWTWESCDWREPTVTEIESHLASLKAAKDRAPRVQKVYMPVIQG